ncbi:amino acid transporter [Bacillus cereus group sp. MYBK163-2]|uniref:amino acid transporter n=1 Tax=Bacillus TaxID=1386 RepID=UPI0035BAD68E
MSTNKKRNKNKQKKEDGIPKISDRDTAKISPYTLSYPLNGKMEYKGINEKGFYKANEKALEILRHEKGLQGKFKKDMNITLINNRVENEEYSLKWEKHSPLSGVGGYFKTFEMKLNKSEKEKIKSDSKFAVKYGLTLSVFVLGIIMFIGLLFFKNESPQNKFIWLLGSLMYGALISIPKNECMNDVKSRWDIIWYNSVLDSPLWLGAIITMFGFYKEGAFGPCIFINILAGFGVFIFFAMRFALNFIMEEKKYFEGNLPSSNKKV